MNPVRGQSARVAQAVRDAAVVAALDVWRLAVESARLQKLSDDLDALGVGGGGSGLITSVEALIEGDATHGVAASAVYQLLVEIGTAFNNVANKNSPALTGVPTAPTASLGDNTTQIATTAFTQEAINLAIGYLISSAPEALDTLTELAAALNDDPDFATTISTALGNRLRFDDVQTLTAPQKAQALTNLGLSSSSNVIGGSGSTASASGMAINCVNTAVNGLNNVAINCNDLTINAAQKGATFDGVQFALSVPVMPKGSKVNGFFTGSARQYLTVSQAFAAVKSAALSKVVQDSDGVKPFFAFDFISPSQNNLTVHKIEVFANTTAYTKIRVLARKWFGVTVLETLSVGVDAPNVVCTEDGTSLDITLSAPGVYNNNQYTYHVFVASKYNI